jgi:hypothetical protein
MPTQITEFPEFGTKQNYHVDITESKPGGMATAAGTLI